MGIKKIMEAPEKIVSTIRNTVTLKRKQVSYAPDLHIEGVLKIYGRGKITFGNRVWINSSERSNPIGGMDHTLISIAHGGELTIGNDVGISNIAIVCHDKITIGDHVRIGGNTMIYDTNFHSLNMSERVSGMEEQVVTAPVHIGEGSFIGAHCIILKGVSIGKNSIVGAGSVVTKSIPDNEIWGGNPAKLIRKQSVTE